MRRLFEPVLAHVHLPKCGGTSFRKMLARHFGPAHVDLYVDDTFFVYSESELTGRLSELSVRAFSSHFVRTFPASLAERDMLYITFLRNPVQQFISYVTYTRKCFDTIHDPNLLGCLPPDLPSLSIRSAAHWILTRNHPVNFRENYTTNFFAWFPFHGRYGGSKSKPFYRETRLELAKRILSNFFFVGITEEMDQSVTLIRSLANERELDFPQGAVGIENTSFEGRGDLTWIHEDDETGALLLRSVREDLQLYNWAFSRFHRRLEAAGTA